jgi:hypothetical protein
MKNSAESRPEERQREGAGLDRQYGTIGISAVAAALRYQSDGKNPAYAPAVTHENERFEVAA